MTALTDSYPTAAETRDQGAKAALAETFRLIKFNSSRGGVQSHPLSGEIGQYVERELVARGYKVERELTRLRVKWDV